MSDEEIRERMRLRLQEHATVTIRCDCAKVPAMWIPFGCSACRFWTLWRAG